MNTQIRTLMIALAAFAPLGAQAEAPDPATTVVINCTYGHWPTRNEVASYLRVPKVTVGEAAARPMDAPNQTIESFARTDVWGIQQFIRKQGRHECEQGATHVQVDFYRQPQDRAVAAVVRTSP